jgi:hypothetical protein
MNKTLVLASTAVLLGSSLGSVQAQLTAIGPFSGGLSEDWESIPAVFGYFYPPPVDIMGGAARVADTPGLAVRSEGWDSLGTSGSPVRAADGSQYAYLSAGTATFTFDQPVWQFGGFWGSYTGGSAGDPQVFHLEFFDELGAALGPMEFDYSHSLAPDGELDWHGWSSTKGIKRIELSTTWYSIVDGLQANVPEPAAFTWVAGFGLLGFCLSRRTRG